LIDKRQLESWKDQIYQIQNQIEVLEERLKQVPMDITTRKTITKLFLASEKLSNEVSRVFNSAQVQARLKDQE
jgi:hypothetical protein